MKQGFIHVCFIIDESSSMSISTEQVTQGFEKFIKEQSEITNGKCAVSLYKFSNDVKQVYIGKDVKEIKGLSYRPHGCTAMNDGIGTAIDEVGVWLSNMDEDERPSKNLIVIMTDGFENASKEYSFDKVQSMIEHQETKYNWTFVYMGTDITSLDDIKKLGIHVSSVSSRDDYLNNYKRISALNKSYRLATNELEASATLDMFISELDEVTTKYEKDNNITLK